MESAQHSRIADFIWGIADDVLRDVYVRGKYRDVILPMVVIRRLDSVLESTKDDVLRLKKRLDEAEIVNQEQALQGAAKQAFYNTSPFTLRTLLDQPQQLRPNFEAYLDGFSSNIQEILEKFKFRNQLPTLVEHDALGYLVEKFVGASINLSPYPVLDNTGHVLHVGLDNHGMGTVFEELIRRFNEENNEEAGEHFTPRDVILLMADLIFLPIADAIADATYLVYDGACGTGGMLTVAAERLEALAEAKAKNVSIHLFGQEINPETYAITKADLLLKGEGAEANNIKTLSTLAHDAFPTHQFDFMLSNPPYGKSWKRDLETLGGKSGMHDKRFVTQHAEESAMSLVTRTTDGQMLFLVNLLSKMKTDTPLGSRIAEVHNGSSLFTGDAGQGESNIRRWIIENDWLEAIIALPLNIFYNTGIPTYIWLLSNRKSVERRGKVQLIDASEWFRPLRRNLGKKNCELGPDDISRIVSAYLTMQQSDQSKVFSNEAFGYWKITTERPLRLKIKLSFADLAHFENICQSVNEPQLAEVLRLVRAELKSESHSDFNVFKDTVEKIASSQRLKLNTRHWSLIRAELTERDEQAAPVIAKERKGRDGVKETTYESDPELRGNEQVPLLSVGGIEGFMAREVLPYAPDTWVDEHKTQIGYEISFTRHFYKPKRLRTMAEIRVDIEALQQESGRLLDAILVR